MDLTKQRYNTIFLNAGHGGWLGDSSDIRNYTTFPSKTAFFKTNPNNTRMHGTINGKQAFLEGIKNREYIDIIEKKLAGKCNVVKVYNNRHDTPLKSRVNIANHYHSTISKGLYVSEHSNAHNTRARGLSIWTSRGQTTSDVLAEKLFKKFSKSSKLPPNVSLRRQSYSDGDSDYEANFYELRETIMPAILLENLFFDNIDDVELLNLPEYIDIYTDYVAEWCVESLIYMNSK